MWFVAETTKDRALCIAASWVKIVGGAENCNFSTQFRRTVAYFRQVFQIFHFAPNFFLQNGFFLAPYVAFLDAIFRQDVPTIFRQTKTASCPLGHDATAYPVHAPKELLGVSVAL